MIQIADQGCMEEAAAHDVIQSIHLVYRPVKLGFSTEGAHGHILIAIWNTPEGSLHFSPQP